MNGNLVFTTTSDYARLHGFYKKSQTRVDLAPKWGELDSVVLTHGLGGNFYSSRLLLHFAQTFLDLGLSVVIGNTRGHDMVNSTTWGGRTQSIGSALENVSDCIFDLASWSDFLVKKGHRKVLLFGHSLGAIKSLYAQAHSPHSAVAAIIGLSATRLGYHKLIATPRGALFRETIERCRSLIESGSGETPVHVMFPFPTWMTPQCYLDKYGPDETYNWINFIEKVETPTLMLFGQKELDDDPAFEGVRDELQQLKTSWNAPEIREIEEADHFYSAKFNEVDQVIRQWIC
ncbi:MAG: alpha/beta fold hydrolase [Planctomycetota bacterium]